MAGCWAALMAWGRRGDATARRGSTGGASMACENRAARRRDTTGRRRPPQAALCHGRRRCAASTAVGRGVTRAGRGEARCAGERGWAGWCCARRGGARAGRRGDARAGADRRPWRGGAALRLRRRAAAAAERVCVREGGQQQRARGEEDRAGQARCVTGMGSKGGSSGGDVLDWARSGGAEGEGKGAGQARNRDGTAGDLDVGSVPRGNRKSGGR